jgi:protein-S-isoprenylcysteine O-methyltransferase Ste14
MLLSHIILAILWILFGVLHSLLAAGWFKEIVQKRLGRQFRYYTFGYSILATLNLAGILAYQLSMPQIWLWVMPIWAQIAMLIPLSAGIYIMGALIRKYFFALSGISVFYKNQAPVILELGGWHRYVRHPLYFGTLLFVWSLFFIFPTWGNLIACMIITAYTLAGTVLEERKLVMQFGSEYIEYQRRVPMILPRFIGSKN